MSSVDELEAGDDCCAIRCFRGVQKSPAPATASLNFFSYLKKLTVAIIKVSIEGIASGVPLFTNHPRGVDEVRETRVMDFVKVFLTTLISISADCFHRYKPLKYSSDNFELALQCLISYIEVTLIS